MTRLGRPRCDFPCHPPLLDQRTDWKTADSPVWFSTVL